ncbi:hypothetical protein DFJ73DRAFT_766859 [Zopfochytrium polystomum]|nr:hypothetical protein DFJ73DRAFT_766859 [Zopfochytrium polystomum]
MHDRRAAADAAQAAASTSMARQQLNRADISGAQRVARTMLGGLIVNGRWTLSMHQQRPHRSVTHGRRELHVSAAAALFARLSSLDPSRPPRPAFLHPPKDPSSLRTAPAVATIPRSVFPPEKPVSPRSHKIRTSRSCSTGLASRWTDQGVRPGRQIDGWQRLLNAIEATPDKPIASETKTLEHRPASELIGEVNTILSFQSSDRWTLAARHIFSYFPKNTAFHAHFHPRSVESAFCAVTADAARSGVPDDLIPRLFEEYQDKVRSSYGIKTTLPNGGGIWAAWIRGLCDAGNARQAVEVFRQARAAGLPATSTLLGRIILQCTNDETEFAVSALEAVYKTKSSTPFNNTLLASPIPTHLLNHVLRLCFAHEDPSIRNRVDAILPLFETGNAKNSNIAAARLDAETVAVIVDGMVSLRGRSGVEDAVAWIERVAPGSLKCRDAVQASVVRAAIHSVRLENAANFVHDESDISQTSQQSLTKEQLGFVMDCVARVRSWRTPGSLVGPQLQEALQSGINASESGEAVVERVVVGRIQEGDGEIVRQTVAEWVAKANMGPTDAISLSKRARERLCRGISALGMTKDKKGLLWVQAALVDRSGGACHPAVSRALVKAFVATGDIESGVKVLEVGLAPAATELTPESQSVTNHLVAASLSSTSLDRQRQRTVLSLLRGAAIEQASGVVLRVAHLSARLGIRLSFEEVRRSVLGVMALSQKKRDANSRSDGAELVLVGGRVKRAWVPGAEDMKVADEFARGLLEAADGFRSSHNGDPTPQTGRVAVTPF